jgi:BirA family biotin operon repressor/biotin-[acetyl-CoA-carboxylase] ligase
MSWSWEEEVGDLGEGQDDPAELALTLDGLQLLRQIHYFREIDSTSRWLLQLVESATSSKALDGILVIADYQTAGKGRFGRPWLAPRGKALLFSLVLRAQSPAPLADDYNLRLISLLAPVAVALALRNVAGVAASIKFPNDIMVGPRKCAGILLERSAKYPDLFILGIGINVNQSKEELPPQTHVEPTSLFCETGMLLNRWVVLRGVLEELEAWWSKKNLDEIVNKLNELCTTLGRRVLVKTATGDVEGLAVGISPNGGLLVRADHGAVTEILSGDVKELQSGYE